MASLSSETPVRLAAAASALAESIGFYDPELRADQEKVFAWAGTVLTPEELETARKSGEGMTTDEAMQLILPEDRAPDPAPR